MARSRHPRFLAFLAVLGGATAALVPLVGLLKGTVIGFDIAALVFVLSCIPLWREEEVEGIRARAARDDGGRALLLLTSLVLLLVILVTLALMVRGRAALGPWDFALVTLTLMLAWTFGNLVYAFHYGHLYYDCEARPGLDFPGGEPPLFADFCYFSFVLGMTFQVSDVQILTRAFRREATLHGLFAFFFNLGVLALTINVLAGVL